MEESSVLEDRVNCGIAVKQEVSASVGPYMIALSYYSSFPWRPIVYSIISFILQSNTTDRQYFSSLVTVSLEMETLGPRPTLPRNKMLVVSCEELIWVGNKGGNRMKWILSQSTEAYMEGW